MVGLKRFLYLDADALAGYLSSLEDGIRGSRALRNSTVGEGGGGLDIKVVKAEGKLAREREEELEFADTPQARFDRLEQICVANEESTGWLRVIDPDSDLDTAGIGAMIDIECDVYIPGFMNAMSQFDDYLAIGKIIGQIAPHAEALGIENVPDLKMVDAIKDMEGVMHLFDRFRVVVAEVEESDWQLAGQVDTRFINGDLDGTVRLVGKVKAKWDKGSWKPLMALPGTKLLPRDKRRQLERQKPEVGKEDQYLQGPALMIDILAIYR